MSHLPDEDDSQAWQGKGRPPASNTPNHPASQSDAEWDAALRAMNGEPELALTEPVAATPLQANVSPAPLKLVETAFLSSTAGLLWLVSYYLSLVPWMRMVLPLPIALVYLRWGARAAWMSLLVTGLLLSVLMGPFLSILFVIPYGLLGVQLGFLWRRGAGWPVSISIGAVMATLGLFARVALSSAFLGEDLWVYLTRRIADLMEWLLTRLVDWGLLDVSVLGQVNLAAVQALTVGAFLLSDLVYLFTIHLAGWLLLERLGNAIPEPPRWVRVLLEEE
ncbi:MAG: DUF2232 domain-containing protein [Cyanobacteria bacterium J069]|nr:MAG: DUF2232 domain-containing protein [Cyanobacteria bacterium J069]